MKQINWLMMQWLIINIRMVTYSNSNKEKCIKAVKLKTNKIMDAIEKFISKIVI